MDSFFGLLVAIVGLMTVITLSIMELWVIPWPILLILLLLTLWISQRLIDRFNPAPVEGLNSVSADPSTGSSPTVAEPEPHTDPVALCYRGQLYEEPHQATASPPSAAASEAPKEGVTHKCYRGIPLQSPDSAPSQDSSSESVPLPNPKLSYRGIKRS
ncbi:MAG: hypothetical protein ACO37W_03175 [Prochlorotrichaceae cyanobacterium]